MNIETVPSDIETRGFSFSGRAGEYFGIWIVNLLLSILTIGIYTAWAKVRRLRYFYGNTWLDGHNFEYHAKPVQILIGRIIVVVVLVVLNLLASVSPLISLVIIVPYLVGLPWLINKALAFNARMTSYRNIRFGFEGSYGRAFWVFVVLPFAIPVLFSVVVAAMVFSMDTDLATSTGSEQWVLVAIAALIGIGAILYLLMIPYISKQTNTYIASRTRFGSAKFEADISLGALYSNMGLAALVALGPVIVIGLLVALSASAFVGASGIGQAIAPFIYIAFLVGYLVYAAGVRNIAFNATRLEGGHQLHSGLSRMRYAWIIISNLFASVVSIGLLIPWAAVRKWRYLADNTSLEGPGLERFIAAEEAQGNVTAAEYLDIDGIDFGL
ncbi:MAG: YjgN family protein [Pseudomonadota bacterium]